MTKPVKVLIVEDDEWLAEQHMRALQAEGIHAEHAPHALAAIDQIDSLVPDVIILDVFLPGQNAFTLLHELQSHTDLAGIPVVLCTNSASSLERQDLTAYGVRQVLDKSTMALDDIVVAVRKATLL